MTEKQLRFWVALLALLLAVSTAVNYWTAYETYKHIKEDWEYEALTSY